MNSKFLLLGLTLLGASVSTEASLIYSADFSGYTVGATPTINNTGDDNTFTQLTDSGVGGSFTVQAAASPYASNYVQLARASGESTAFNRFAQSRITDMSLTGQTSMFVVSFDYNRTSAGSANLQVTLTDSGNSGIGASNLTLDNPAVSENLRRATYVYNGTGADIPLPGTMGNLASGSAALYSYNGTTFTLDSTVVVGGSGNIGGFAIRTNLNAGRASNFDNFGVWDSFSDSFGGVNVLQLAPGTVVPEPTVASAVALGLFCLGATRSFRRAVRS